MSTVKTVNNRKSTILFHIAVFSAAMLWILLCVIWFDDGAPFRPRALESVSPVFVLILLAAILMILLFKRRDSSWGASTPVDRLIVLVCLLAFFFRLPMAWQGAAGYLTPDGSLSGIVSVHVRDGIDHHVFLPRLAYSGSLKSHITALLALFMDSARAFALVSVLFYVAFVGAVCRLAKMFDDDANGTIVAAAGLLAAFAPPFVTRYSLSNDGNYVEVLTFGTWALVVAYYWKRQPDHKSRRALIIGILLGLALWCHILALYYVVTVALVMLASGWRAWPSYICYALGLSIGYFPGILWNANHGWDSLAYVLGHKAVGEIVTRPSLWSRLVMLVSKQLPILVGYEATEPSWLDWARWGFVCLVLASIAVGLWQAGTRASRGSIVDRILLTFVAVNIGVCVFALPYLPGMPRYLLFLTAPFAVLLARSFHERMSRLWIAAIIAVNALSSWALLPAARERDHGRRELAHALESLGVRYCYSDFSLAPIINFLSEEKVVCTTKLGPTTTEHFFEHRRAVEAAATAAFVPVNSTAAAKLERRLERLGVSFERTDFMKPVIYRLSRKVDPQELFPQRDFPWR